MKIKKIHACKKCNLNYIQTKQSQKFMRNGKNKYIYHFNKIVRHKLVSVISD